jgi:L-cysteine:1D-myo-inositol 2-amino-2-deoxy-alpha-D-glucopyranoside ligase
MAMRYLGSTVDIHGGGYDLVFPHHECEIAQSENATGVEPFVRTWMHVAMVDYQGEKMSKSLGNLVLASNVLREYSSDAFRLYLHDHHYRSTWEYIDGEIDAWACTAQELAQALVTASDEGAPLDVSELEQRFMDALADDLDTKSAIDALVEIGERISGAEGANLNGAQSALKRSAGILGVTNARQARAIIANGPICRARFVFSFVMGHAHVLSPPGRIGSHASPATRGKPTERGTVWQVTHASRAPMSSWPFCFQNWLTRT